MCRFVFSPFSHDEHPSLAFGCLAASSGCTALSCEPDFMAFSLKCKLREKSPAQQVNWVCLNLRCVAGGRRSISEYDQGRGLYQSMIKVEVYIRV